MITHCVRASGALVLAVAVMAVIVARESEWVRVVDSPIVVECTVLAMHVMWRHAVVWSVPPMPELPVAVRGVASRLRLVTCAAAAHRVERRLVLAIGRVVRVKRGRREKRGRQLEVLHWRVGVLATLAPAADVRGNWCVPRAMVDGLSPATLAAPAAFVLVVLLLAATLLGAVVRLPATSAICRARKDCHGGSRGGKIGRRNRYDDGLLVLELQRRCLLLGEHHRLDMCVVLAGVVLVVLVVAVALLKFVAPLATT